MEHNVETSSPATIPQIQLIYVSGSPHDPQQVVNDSETAYKHFKESWNQETIELLVECKVMYLNRAAQLLGIYPVSSGGRVDAEVDPRLIFAGALLCAATDIVVCHNHPSGNLKLSDTSKAFARKLQEGAKLFDMKLKDFLIISTTGYKSMCDDGLL
ncbi:JAB domain-containing protein [Puia dinghuensis]|uniref:DNA repair protein n=1 Tax=Puia dinghuensis TaxID=1792502 RepID=A0A8J2XS73_9BACT|nr:JAB domain-containing protein [Puia dinghuensis]GGA92769.1 DNA repair protein [Puia dinghuensis]